MDSHETNLTGDDEIIVTKTIRSVSGKFVSVNRTIRVTQSHVLISRYEDRKQNTVIRKVLY